MASVLASPEELAPKHLCKKCCVQCVHLPGSHRAQLWGLLAPSGGQINTENNGRAKPQVLFSPEACVLSYLASEWRHGGPCSEDGLAFELEPE